MNYIELFSRLKRAIDQAIDRATRGSYLSNAPLKLAIYVLLFVGLPLLVLVSLPYGIGVIVLVGIVILALLGLVPFNF